MIVKSDYGETFMTARLARIHSLLLMVFLCGSVEAIACSCSAQPENIETAVTEAYQGADLIFMGEVVNIEVHNRKEKPEPDLSDFPVDENGSRLSQVDIQAPSPVTAVGQEDIEALREALADWELNAEYQIATLRLIEKWKGDAEAVVVIKVTTECCLCGYRFEQGETYLVYANGPYEDGYYSTTSCTRTRLFDQSDADIKELDKLRLSKE